MELYSSSPAPYRISNLICCRVSTAEAKQASLVLGWTYTQTQDVFTKFHSRPSKKWCRKKIKIYLLLFPVCCDAYRPEFPTKAEMLMNVTGHTISYHISYHMSACVDLFMCARIYTHCCTPRKARRARSGCLFRRNTQSQYTSSSFSLSRAYSVKRGG